MTQQALFPREARQRQSAKRGSSVHIEKRVVFRELSAHEQALHRDERLRGTGHARELAFREALWQWIVEYESVLPEPLAELVMDHAMRSDGMHLSLCFNGPLRQAMLVEVALWLATVEQPAMRVRWEALVASQQETGA